MTDTVLFLEHPPVVKPGRRRCRRAPTFERRPRSMASRRIARKSDFHGPGQLVCYPILDRKPPRKDVKSTCADTGRGPDPQNTALGPVDGARRVTGVWSSSRRERCSIGA